MVVNQGQSSDEDLTAEKFFGLIVLGGVVIIGITILGEYLFPSGK